MSRRSLPIALLLAAGLLHGSSATHPQPEEERRKTSMWKVRIEPAGEGKFKIEAGVFAIGDPVHETLTLHGLINGGTLPAASSAAGPAAQFIRGVFWNDDPCAQLLTENDFEPLEPSLGAAWYLDFRRAQGQAGGGTATRGLDCPLLGRSHFGDLQFLHAMAARDGVAAAETARQMLAWASIVYRIARGDLGHSTPLRTDPTASALIPTLAERSPMDLLRAKTGSETRSRAFGSLLHMLQDSYAAGHVSRVNASGGDRTGIRQFLSYVHQDKAKHAHDDSWRDGSDDLSRTLSIPGAPAALAESTALARLYAARAPWPAVADHLRNGPFYVRSDAVESGPGKYYSAAGPSSRSPRAAGS